MPVHEPTTCWTVIRHAAAGSDDQQLDRLGRVPPRRRPHYGPVQRMRILKLKAARGWSSSQVAQIFAITEETIASWLKRVDEAVAAGSTAAPDPLAAALSIGASF